MFNLPRAAVFPVAGRGTRMLPATRAVPKELLPILDRPILDFAVDEAIEAGIRRLVFVTHPAKRAIQDHIQARDDLPADTEIIFVNQPQPLGLGHAVLQAREHVGNGPVAVLLPDDVILGSPGAILQMIDAAARSDFSHLVATMKVSRSEVSRYGVLAPSAQETNGLLPASTVVEKPHPNRSPSCHAAIGRYILGPSIFEHLAVTRPGAAGEIQLTDAIASDAAERGLAGVAFIGTRFDCGSKAGYLLATLARAGADPEYASLLASSRAA